MKAIEVFSYDLNKSFGYVIQFNNHSINKLNKHIVVSLDEGRYKLTINQKNKFAHSVSAEAMKSAISSLNLGEYKNIKIAKELFLNHIKNIDLEFEKNMHKKTFINYNLINNSSLDILDDNPENSNEYKNAEIAISTNNKMLLDYSIKNIKIFL